MYRIVVAVIDVEAPLLRCTQYSDVKLYYSEEVGSSIFQKKWTPICWVVGDRGVGDERVS